ncbi:MAG: acyltransferase family protein [Janthinobacterium lividum]
MAARETIRSIQYVRAVAALVVIVWHTGWARTVLGQSGVDLFFVVSGFVMMLVSGRESSPISFGLARFARIAPLYWAVTLLIALIDHSPVQKVMTSLLFWPDGQFPLVIQGWSLNLEMSYYALFASTLLAPVRWRVPMLSAEMLIVCVALPIIAPGSKAIAAWASPQGFEFLAGAGLYLLWQRQRLPIGWTAWLIGALGVGALMLTHLLGGAPEHWLRVVLWGVPALVIVAAGLGIERAGQLPRSRLLEKLGEASYSIYLTHFLLIRAIGGVLVTLWAPVAVSLIVVIACLLGLVVHQLFERPVHRWSSGVLARARDRQDRHRPLDRPYLSLDDVPPRDVGA